MVTFYFFTILGVDSDALSQSQCAVLFIQLIVKIEKLKENHSVLFIQLIVKIENLTKKNKNEVQHALFHHKIANSMSILN